jgi:hypothetical protein
MPYKIAGIDVHKRMLAVVVSDVEVDGEYAFERRQFGSNPATRFIAFRSHWGFQSEFCTPGEGHEKGGVGGEGGYFRRNHIVPVPKVASWEALNLYLLEESRRDEQRWIAERSQSVGAGMNRKREHLRALAKEGFDLARVHFPQVNSSGCVRVLTNFYSAPLPVGSRCRPRCTPRTWRFGTRDSVWRGTNVVSTDGRRY